MKHQSFELDKIIDKEYKILDYGYIKVLDYMGNDNSICEAARISYLYDSPKSKDEALINYLIEHAHTSPLEQCSIKFQIKLPIFVARQWMRHRACSYSEVSGRYQKLTDDKYIPEKFYKQSRINHQSSDKDNELSGREIYKNNFNYIHNTIQEDYDRFIKEDMAKEQARMILPLSQYTEMIWKINLHNLLHFLKLRNDSHSQYEIQEYAKCIEDIVSKWVPLAYKAYINFKKESIIFSKEEQTIISKYLKESKFINLEDYLINKENFSRRKIVDLVNKTNKIGII